MKIVSRDDNGNVLVEFENLVQHHPSIIGEMLPVRMLIPEKDFPVAQEICNVVGKKAAEAARKTLALMSELDDRPISIQFPSLL